MFAIAAGTCMFNNSRQSLPVVTEFFKKLFNILDVKNTVISVRFYNIILC